MTFPDSRPITPHVPAGPASMVATRRDFVRLAVLSAAALLVPLAPGGAYAQRLLVGLRSDGHPEPRPGIDGSRVMTAGQMKEPAAVIELFDGIREIPHIADGIRCYCGCAQVEGYRSLLVCYESPGMSRYCLICQGQGRLAYARWKEGQTLDQIRRATDARYGSGSAPGHAVSHAGHAHHHHAHHHHTL